MAKNKRNMIGEDLAGWKIYLVGCFIFSNEINVRVLVFDEKRFKRFEKISKTFYGAMVKLLKYEPGFVCEKELRICNCRIGRMLSGNLKKVEKIMTLDEFEKSLDVFRKKESKSN